MKHLIKVVAFIVIGSFLSVAGVNFNNITMMVVGLIIAAIPMIDSFLAFLHE